jgi:D-glycero-D-manno-heptose 1,7-bisphosphate phosphatase
MIQQALLDFPDIQVTKSYIIGDKATDVEFAHNAGVRSILVRTGYGQNVVDGKYQALTHTPIAICADVPEAVDYIIDAWKKEGLL